jgi:hypothetical protein
MTKPHWRPPGELRAAPLPHRCRVPPVRGPGSGLPPPISNVIPGTPPYGLDLIDDGRSASRNTEESSNPQPSSGLVFDRHEWPTFRPALTLGYAGALFCRDHNCWFVRWPAEAARVRFVCARCAPVSCQPTSALKRWSRSAALRHDDSDGAPRREVAPLGDASRLASPVFEDPSARPISERMGGRVCTALSASDSLTRWSFGFLVRSRSPKAAP